MFGFMGAWLRSETRRASRRAEGIPEETGNSFRAGWQKTLSDANRSPQFISALTIGHQIEARRSNNRYPDCTTRYGLSVPSCASLSDRVQYENEVLR
jgi:hypothetical protein